MFKLPALLFVFIACGLPAQTRLIAHKSHSGSKASFLLALRNGLPDTDNSGFGRAPERTVTFAKLDSVIFVSDSVAVMVTSNYCSMTLDMEHSSLWSRGKDTVLNHPLFTMQHELDSIKKALQNQYYFRNPVDSVRFIGYDNDKKKVKQQQNQQQRDEILPVLNPLDGNGPKPPAGNIAILIAILSLGSLMAGFASRKFVKPLIRL